MSHESPREWTPSDNEPTLERQHELRNARRQNALVGNPPFRGVRIRGKGELTWIMAEQGWSGELDLPDGKSRVDLRGAMLAGTNLSYLALGRANLGGADLREANLGGTYLREADLKGADLRNVVMNSETTLDGAALDSYTMFGGARWHGVYLALVNWQQVSRLGDEVAIKQAKNRRGRLAAYRKAIDAYASLVFALREGGLKAESSRFRLRGQQLERRLHLLKLHIPTWLFFALLEATSGYGEKPGRAFRAYILVVSVFSLFDWLVTNNLSSGLTKLSWDEALVLSVTSFHGRGFFPGSLTLGDWLARISAVEAVMGLFIELVFIATFTRRFLGD